MSFFSKMPEWFKTGPEPGQQKKNEGWQPDERPPAGFFNWFWNAVYTCFLELLSKHIDLNGGIEGQDLHGIGQNEYVAKTTRSDQWPAWGDIQEIPCSFPPAKHANSHKVGGNDVLTPADIGAETPDGAQAKVNTHENKTSTHGATAVVTPNRIMMRDSAGRAKVAPPSESGDIARKDTVDAHANATSVHGATPSTVANRLIIRDGNGRASVVGPTIPSHIATKGYVDGLVGSLQAGTAFAYYLTPPNVELSSNNTDYDDWWVRDENKSVVVRILLPGTIRYHVQYKTDGPGYCYGRILLNGDQIREVSIGSYSWLTVTDNITVDPGDIVTIQKRGESGVWRNVRIETAQPTLGIQRF